MKYSTHVKTIRYLKSHTAEIVTTLTITRGPLVITENGEAKVVVMDVQSYEQQEQTLALLKILARGNREIEQGQYRSAKDVFADLDKEK